MGFREVSVIEVREVLRGWLDGKGLRTVAERAGVDRKTARRYVEAAQAAGLDRSAGLPAVDDALIGQVVQAVRPARPNGHGAAWAALLAREEQIRGWVVGDGEDAKPLSIVKIDELLARRGVHVPYRTLHRFATERCGYRAVCLSFSRSASKVPRGRRACAVVVGSRICWPSLRPHGVSDAPSVVLRSTATTDLLLVG
jgi:hypothetical protein